MSGIDLPKKSKTKASHCTIIQSTSVLRVFTSSYFTEFNSKNKASHRTIIQSTSMLREKQKSHLSRFSATETL